MKSIRGRIIILGQFCELIPGHLVGELTKFNEMSDSKLCEELDPSSFPVPVEYPSKGTLISILLFHEGYHNGRIGLIRRALGKAPAIP